MKKISCFLFLFTTICGFSQSLEKLKSDAQKMYDASYNMDFEAVMDFTYPKFFELTTRENLIKVMDETFQNDTMKVRLVYPSVTFKYSDVKTIEGRKFCVIRYRNAMRMTYFQPIPANRVDEFLQPMKDSKKFEAVMFEKDRNSIFLTGTAIMLAVSDDLTKGEWKFINYDDEKILEILFVKNLKTELGL